MRIPPAPLTKRAACACKRPYGSRNSRKQSVAAAPAVVQADTHNIVGQAAVEGDDGTHPCGGNRLLKLSEIEIEVSSFALQPPPSAPSMPAPAVHPARKSLMVATVAPGTPATVIV